MDGGGPIQVREDGVCRVRLWMGDQFSLEVPRVLSSSPASGRVVLASHILQQIGTTHNTYIHHSIQKIN